MPRKRRQSVVGWTACEFPIIQRDPDEQVIWVELCTGQWHRGCRGEKATCRYAGCLRGDCRQVKLMVEGVDVETVEEI